MKDNKIYRKNIFWIFVPVNTLASFILYLFDIGFANLLVFGPIQSFCIFYAGFIFVQFIVTPLVTYSYTRKVKKSLSFYLAGDTSEEERTDLVRRLNKFPIQKALDTTFLFFFGNIFILLSLGKWINLNLKNLLPVALGSWGIAYLCGTMAFGLAQKVCSVFASKVVIQGIDEKVVKEEKYFGLSDARVLLFLVIVPICTSSLLVFFCSFVTGNQLLKMAFCVFFTIIIAVIGFVMFSSYMKRYLKKVQKSLEIVSLEKIGHFNYSDNIKDFDMANNYTYSIYLTSKSIEMFLKMIDETKKLSLEFATVSEGLNSSSEDAVSVINNQKNDISGLRSSINTTSKLSSDILNRVQEVNSVAIKTDSDVNYCMEAIKDNIFKMKEIITANRSTIHGIKDLANKITTVREIINLIDTVAEQTKIIAFNTEIEAESIKSNDEVFFNLATEIRSLADSTMDLTKQIRNQIKELQNSTATLVITGENCTKKITDGNNFMLELERRFSDIKVETANMANYSGKTNTDLNTDSDVFTNILSKLNDVDSGLLSFTKNSNEVVSILGNLTQNTKTIENLSFGNI